VAAGTFDAKKVTCQNTMMMTITKGILTQTNAGS
jgi:hypothetical protein